MERTEEQRCSVLWLMGLSRSSWSSVANLSVLPNLQADNKVAVASN
jgi:adenylylsulfate kinase-like enzyme